jgi:hypothetical protein
MYEFNQVGYSSLPTMTKEDLHKAETTVKNFLSDNPSKYYMMLNNDEHYYTIYTFTDNYRFTDMAAEIVDVATTLGEVKSIEISEDKHKVEFWITKGKDECIVYYLFDYAIGVIEV